MAIFFDAPVSPDDLTVFIREIPLPSDFTLSTLFPTQMKTTNTIDFAEIIKTNRTARYRSFDGRIHVSERDSGSEKRVGLMPLSTSLSMGEYERLQLEFARTGGTKQEALANAIYNDGFQLTREVQARLEQAWGDVLTDGKLTIDEEGFQGEADFGVPANQIVAAAIAWTDLTLAVPLTNLLAWQDVRVANGNGKFANLLTSLRMTRLMQRNKEVIDAVYGNTAGRTRVSLTELSELLTSEGLGTLLPAYDTQVDVDGVSTRVIPDDKIVMLPAAVADLGYMANGVSATALELVDSSESDLSFEEAPGIVGIVEKSGPPYRKFTFVDTTQMPILANSKLLSVADAA